MTFKISTKSLSNLTLKDHFVEMDNSSDCLAGVDAFTIPPLTADEANALQQLVVQIFEKLGGGAIRSGRFPELEFTNGVLDFCYVDVTGITLEGLQNGRSVGAGGRARDSDTMDVRG